MLSHPLRSTFWHSCTQTYLYQIYKATYSTPHNWFPYQKEIAPRILRDLTFWYGFLNFVNFWSVIFWSHRVTWIWMIIELQNDGAFLWHVFWYKGICSIFFFVIYIMFPRIPRLGRVSEIFLSKKSHCVPYKVIHNFCILVWRIWEVALNVFLWSLVHSLW